MLPALILNFCPMICGFAHEPMGTRPMIRGIVAASVGILLSLSSSVQAEPTSPQPAPLTVPDKALLLRIAKEAIRVRLPSVRLEDLQLARLSYSYDLHDLDNSVWLDQFNVEFSEKDGTKKVEENGATVFEVESLTVTIEPDGKIGEFGVERTIRKFRSADLNLYSNLSSTGTPIRGSPFYPVKLDAPLAKPDRARLKAIALDAILRFLPAVDVKDLDLRSVSFNYRPKDSPPSERFWLVFWIKRSVKITETKTETTIDRNEVSVYIRPTGDVERSDVCEYPSMRTTYNKQNDATTTPDASAPKGAVTK